MGTQLSPRAAKGAQQPPLFGPSLLWPRSPISATAELLFKQNFTSTDDAGCLTKTNSKDQLVFKGI